MKASIYASIFIFILSIKARDKTIHLQFIVMCEHEKKEPAAVPGTRNNRVFGWRGSVFFFRLRSLPPCAQQKQRSEFLSFRLKVVRASSVLFT